MMMATAVKTEIKSLESEIRSLVGELCSLDGRINKFSVRTIAGCILWGNYDVREVLNTGIKTVDYLLEHSQMQATSGDFSRCLGFTISHGTSLTPLICGVVHRMDDTYRTGSSVLYELVSRELGMTYIKKANELIVAIERLEGLVGRC